MFLRDSPSAKSIRMKQKIRKHEFKYPSPCSAICIMQVHSARIFASSNQSFYSLCVQRSNRKKFTSCRLAASFKKFWQQIIINHTHTRKPARPEHFVPFLCVYNCWFAQKELCSKNCFYLVRRHKCRNSMNVDTKKLRIALLLLKVSALYTCACAHAHFDVLGLQVESKPWFSTIKICLHHRFVCSCVVLSIANQLSVIC